MKKADEIKFKLMSWCIGTPTDIVVPNFFINTHYEMDLFRLTKAGLVYEYEIKISRSDFKNDFKKGSDSYSGLTKHDTLKNGNRICNYFYFVVPENLVDKSEIPNYCGLMYYTERHLHIVKNAPKLHKNKYTDYATLCEKLAYRQQIYQNKMIYLNYCLKDVMESNKKLRDILGKHNIEIEF